MGGKDTERQWESTVRKKRLHCLRISCMFRPIQGNLDFKIREMFAHGIRNPRLWDLQFSSGNTESKFHPTRNPQSSTWNPESTACSPGSKTVLDYLTQGDISISLQKFLTSETAVVILLPPDAPITSCTSPILSVKTAADMDENGRLPGSGKLTSDG